MAFDSAHSMFNFSLYVNYEKEKIERLVLILIVSFLCLVTLLHKASQTD